MTAGIPFDNAYAALPERFFARADPAPVRAPQLLRFNGPLAAHLGIDLQLATDAEVWAGNRLPLGAAPIATAYAGHQFGGFVPRLGDGRAVLLGQLRDRDGQSWDIQLKGSGRTPFSRGGDGRAWIGPVLREYVLSEAMHALGIPTTRALAAVSTGQPVYREQVLPGAVLTRVARSHVRVGTFEYFAARGDTEGLHLLLQHVLDRYLPQVDPSGSPAIALLAEVANRQAALVAQWLAVGFIHGVMNTDNCSVVGDTIDYGPCAFLDDYQPDKVFSSIDHGGRYAFHNQPRAAQWNLVAFARALLPLFADDPNGIAAAQGVIDGFPERFARERRRRFGAKLGLATQGARDDALVDDLLVQMAHHGADFTNTFRGLCSLTTSTSGPTDPAGSASFLHGPALAPWRAAWWARLAEEGDDDAARQARMRAVNPATIPRNHRIEEMIQAALHGDLGPLDTLLEVLGSPFEDREAWAGHAAPPEAHEVVHQTFCGT